MIFLQMKQTRCFYEYDTNACLAYLRQEQLMRKG